LAGAVDDPKAAVCGIVADRDISAAFKPVRDDAAVLAVADPGLEVAARLVLDSDQGRGVRVAKPIEHVGEFGVFGGGALASNDVMSSAARYAAT
jgi:hypothetical protein